MDSDSETSLLDEEEVETSLDVNKRKASSDARAPRTKKKKKSNMNLFEDEVEETSDDESEGERGAPLDGTTAAELSRHERETKRLYEERRRNRDAFLDRSEEEIAREVEERHQRRAKAVSRSRYGISDMSLSRDANQPVITDPKLYAVRCKPGEEQLLVVRLMNKFKVISGMKSKKKTSGGNSNSMNILSVTSPGTKGYVYIEARSELAVKEALTGLRDVFQRVTLIPLKEMTKIIAPVGEVKGGKLKKVEVGQLVRVRAHPYKGDLGIIQAAVKGANKVHVKLIPRVDYELARISIEEGMEVGAEHRKRNKKTVFEKARLNLDRLREMRVEVDKHNPVFDPDRQYLYVPVLDEFFLDGFLVKEFPLRNIQIDAVKPTPNELEIFGFFDGENSKTNGLAQDIALLGLSKTKTGAGFSIGDVVIVTKGQLKGLKGRIEEISKGQHKEENSKKEEEFDGNVVFQVRAISETIQELMSLKPGDVRKEIELGNHVKIVAGLHMGVTGDVVSVNEDPPNSGVWKAILVSDLDKREIVCDINDLKKSNEVAGGREELKGFKVYDILKLTSGSTAIIIQVLDDSVKIIDREGRNQVIKLSMIQNKIGIRGTHGLVASDQENREIAIHDTVKIVGGEHKGLEGVVRFIQASTLFIFSKQTMNNSGILVTFSKNCKVIGAKQSSPQKRASFGGDQRTPSRGGRGGRGRGNFTRGFGGRNQGLLQGKTVKIQKGRYKGYVGIVVNVAGPNTKVELHTTGKRVSVAVSDVVEQRKTQATPSSSISHTMPTPAAAPGTPPGTSMNSAPTPGGYMHSYGVPTPGFNGTINTPGPLRSGAVQTPGYGMSGLAGIQTPGMVQTPAATYVPTPAPPMESNAPFRDGETVRVVGGGSAGEYGKFQGMVDGEIFVEINGTKELKILQPNEVVKV